MTGKDDRWSRHQVDIYRAVVVSRHPNRDTLPAVLRNFVATQKD